jgi:hypothetical protein
MDEINQTLDKCFSGCKHMKRWCTKRGNRELQEQYQAWIEYLLENDCDPEFSKLPESQGGDDERESPNRRH